MNSLTVRTADYKLHDTVFRVTYGDITRLSVNVLVSSDDSYLSMGGGVSYAISNAGGETIQRDARKHVPLNIGDVAVTSAGNLSAKYIFHAVTLDYSNMIHPSEESIRTASLKCMQLADILGIKTIAFPALGTGAGGFPFQLAADTMTRSIADYLMGETHLELVILTLFPREYSRESDLNIFYEHATAQASLYSQSKRLNSLLKELKIIADQTNNSSISTLAEDLLVKLTNAQNVLAEKPVDLEQLKQINKQSAIADISGEIIQASSQDIAISEWQNSQLDEKLLQTRLTGLQTQLNIYTSQLNGLEIEKAKYGGIGVPPRLLTAIEDITKEISQKEEQTKHVRSELAALYNRV